MFTLNNNCDVGVMMFHPGISSKQKGNYASPYTFISFCCRRNDELTTFFSHLYEIDSSIVLAENYIKKVEEIVSIKMFYFQNLDYKKTEQEKIEKFTWLHSYLIQSFECKVGRPSIPVLVCAHRRIQNHLVHRL